MSSIQIVLADDHRIVRDGIRSLLESSDSIKVVGEATNGEEAIDLVKKMNPDLLIMDISMPKINGIEAAAMLNKNTQNKTKVLILSMHDQEEYILQALDAGASGYLLKDTEKEELIQAIQKIVSGDKYYGTSISQKMMEAYVNRRSGGKAHLHTNYDAIELTKREREILKNIVDGLSNKEIANKLFISPRTVDTHRANIMEKLSVKNTAELVKIALEKKIV